MVTVVDLDNIPMVLSHRLGLMNTPPLEKVSLTPLSLQEIIIVGNVCDQVSPIQIFSLMEQFSGHAH